MPRCIVPSCTNRSYRKANHQIILEASNKITFHAFPKDPYRRDLWIRNLNMGDQNISHTATVCSIHFKKEDMEIPLIGSRTLLKRAVPYVKVEEHNEGGQVTVNTEGLFEIKNERERTNKPGIEHNVEQPGCSVEKNLRTVFPPLRLCESPIPTPTRSISRGTSISPERNFNSPTKSNLRAQLARERKAHQRQVKILWNKQRRSSNRIQTLSTLLKDLVTKH